MTRCRKTRGSRWFDRRLQSLPEEGEGVDWRGCWASVTSDEDNNVDLLQIRAGKMHEEVRRVEVRRIEERK
jgi:hypothetical protein